MHTYPEALLTIIGIMNWAAIIALVNKMKGSSNISNWNRVELDMVHEGLDGRLVHNWWENMLNCIRLGFKYLKWDTTTTTKVDQSSPYHLNKISNKLLVYTHLIFLRTHSFSVLYQLLSRTTNPRRCPETWSRRRLHPN